MQTITTKTWNFLGSYKLAIVLIAALAFVLGWATFYESSTSSAAAAASFYHSTWFAVLLLLIAVNVTVAAFRRWPWQPKHVGFLITHLALDLLLLGAFITMTSGIDGTMSIVEGATSNTLALDTQIIKVDNEQPATVRKGTSVTLADGSKLQVDQYLDTAQPSLDVREDGERDNPAIHFTIGNGKANTDGWLVAREPELAKQAFGPLQASLTEVTELPGKETVRPHLTLTLGKKNFEVPLTRVGDTVPVAGTDYSVKFVSIFERAGVDKKDLIERKTGGENPAVIFELTRNGDTEKHVTFARFPDFPTFMGKGTAPSAVKVRYEKGSGSTGSGPMASFYWLPDHKLYLQLKGQTYVVEIGKSVPTPWMGMLLTVDRVVDRARVAAVYHTAPQGAPAVQVSLGDDRAWIGYDEKIRLNGHDVSFGPETMGLGLTISLDKFEMKTNPGTNNPASFASQVVVADGSTKFPYRISMNEPLEYAGYTFYQSGYQPGQGGPNTTVLRVARDPGILFKYAGTLLLVLGIAWCFYIEPVLARRRATARATVRAKASPKKNARLATARTMVILAACLALSAPAVYAQAPATPATDAQPANPHAGVPSTDPPHTHGMPADSKNPGVVDPKGANPHSADMMAQADVIPGPTALNLDNARRVAIQANGRVRPFDTYARELVLTVTGRETFDGRDPVDLVLSWTTHGPAWSLKDVIYVPNKALKTAIGLDPEQARFPLQTLSTNQKLRELADAGRAKEQTATANEKEALTVLDRVGVLEAVFSGRILAIVPNGSDPDAAWLAPSDLSTLDPATSAVVINFFRAYNDNDPKFPEAASALETAMRAKGGAVYPTAQNLELELLYNKFRPFRTAWELYLAALVFVGLGAYWTSLRPLALTLALGGFFVHTSGLVMRMLIAHRPPVTNMYESVVWVAWGCAALGLALAWRHRQEGAAVAAAVMSALLLILTDALPGALDPSIQPLMPVLRSNFWLTIHVLTITLSYAAFTLATALGHTWLVMKWRGASSEKRCAISKFLNATLRVGVLLLAAGTLLGGVWAQYSWGRFWGWDPKEVWALIALLCYLLLLHGQFAGWIGPRGVAAGSILGFMGVLMAWYGVNYVLGKGLHSYGFGSGNTTWVVAFVGAELAFLALTMGGRRKAVATDEEPRC